MLFNSIEFLAFLPAVLLGYYLLPHRLQNVFLVLASCFFYASWDWRFLFPLLFSTTIDYFCAARISALIDQNAPTEARKKYLYLSLITNLGLLGFFKYCNFFIDSFHDLFLVFGFDLPKSALNIILPVGISFYTFQALSYTIDVYRGNLHATRSFWDFFLAVLFFPHLVAGPIQRASNLIEQVITPRKVTRVQFIDGLHLCLWGFFKKVYIADSLAPIANQIFGSPTASGGEVVVAVLAFSFQIYCDFSGYTDIARGIAKLMGFEFMLNFNLHYFATSPPDFWQRWHISLSSWLRDYLYITLGGNRVSTIKIYRNLMLTMVLGGLWHGAAWNFIIWGGFHGGILIAHRFAFPILEAITRLASGVSRIPWLIARIAVMFLLTCYGWLLFRATSLDQIMQMSRALAQPLNGLPVESLSRVLVLCAPLLVVQLVQYNTGCLQFNRLVILPKAVYSVIYALMVYYVVFLGGTPQAFVYFQF